MNIRTFKDLVVSLSFASLCVLLIIVGVSVWRMKNAMVTTTEHATLLIDQSNIKLVDTARNTNAVLIQFGLVAENIRRASESQQVYIQRSLRLLDDTQGLLNSAQRAIEHTSDSMNLTVLTVNDTVKTTDQRIQQTLSAANVSLNQARALLTDPKLAEAIANINITTGTLAKAAPSLAENIQVDSQNAKDATEHAGEITLNVEKATRPKGLFRRLMDFIF